MSALPCSGCDQLLPVEAFSPDARVPRGRQARCRACRSADARARRQASGEDEEGVLVEVDGVPGRTCTGCATFRPWVDFHADTHVPEGHRARCVYCRSEERLVAVEAGPILPASLLTCTRCDETHPVEAFRVDARRRNGRAPRCKACEASVRAELRGAARDVRVADLEVLRTSGADAQMCEVCHVSLPFPAFRKHVRSLTGYTRTCSACLSAREVERAQANADPMDLTIRALRDRARERDEEIRTMVRAATELPPRSPRSG